MFLRATYWPGSSKESVYFFTFPRCASSLFGKYVLRRLNHLHQADYAAYLWSKPMDHPIDLRFRSTGYVYGPIRLSSGSSSNTLLGMTTTKEFLADKKAIFLVRDPRDLLISQYYSVGYSHPVSPDPVKRDRLLKNREIAQGQTIDEYVLDNLDRQVENFNFLLEVKSRCRESILLKFEDMIDHFDDFIAQLRTQVDISDRAVSDIYKRSRPREKVTITHRRSGKSGQYERALKSETVSALNLKLAPILETLGYARRDQDK